ncbi:uncharacterized protein EV154DRAFT_421276, partial [Mucor mucedo]|uniref:uncharacterized protein n=1 Tax=Mucor mucedo TaxID=29922 RepID=UPI00221EF994
MSSTIQVSIYFTNEPTIEFDFLSEKLNWTNLVTLIESTRRVDSPVVLYYKKDNETESLENQSQLESLLSLPEIKGLCFYAQADLVSENVYILPGHAFARLTQFVDQHKEIVSSSHRLARWVGILASFIAEDTTDHHFDYEFKVLDTLAARKSEKMKRR